MAPCTHPGMKRLFFLKAKNSLITKRLFAQRKKSASLLSPSCFAVCGRHRSPRIAIVFSQLSSEPNCSMPHSLIFLISSSNTPCSLLCISHYFLLLIRVPGMLLLLSNALPQGRICEHLPPPPDYSTVIPLSSFWQVQVPYPKS